MLYTAPTSRYDPVEESLISQIGDHKIYHKIDHQIYHKIYHKIYQNKSLIHKIKGVPEVTTGFVFVIENKVVDRFEFYFFSCDAEGWEIMYGR